MESNAIHARVLEEAAKSQFARHGSSFQKSSANYVWVGSERLRERDKEGEREMEREREKEMERERGREMEKERGR